jgi:general stress protein 26
MTESRRAPSPATVWRTVERASFCTLATSSPTNQPHVVGVLYAVVDRALWLNTESHSKKARNIRDNGNVAVCIPVRKFPVGPPFCVQFAATAELVPVNDPAVAPLMNNGRLKRITSHGELDSPDSTFIRLTPARKVFTYGIGVPLLTLLRDPLHAMRTVDMESAG